MERNVKRNDVMELDVLVVGAGPVGLTMAAELARFGLRVRIIDKAATPTDKSKALVVWTRTLELLARAGCADAFIAAGHPVHATSFFAGGGRLGQVSFTGIDSPYPYALMLPQSETERLLDQHLRGFGVTVERGIELTGFAEAGGGITADLRHADGEIETCQARWLAGCDGAHSLVRHRLGFAFAGGTMQTDWILADLHLQGLPSTQDELAMFLHQEGILAVFPITAGRYRVIADAGAAAGIHPATPTLAEVQAVIGRRAGAGISASDPVWLSGFRINERKVERYRLGNVFLAGDAAHVHSPAGGQGMNTGMQDAFNLAWKLAMVHGGAAPDTLLDSYTQERSAVGDQVLKDAGQVTAFGVLRGRPSQLLRNTLINVLTRLPQVRRVLSRKFSEVAIHYQDSALNGPNVAGLRGPAPGARMPGVSAPAPAGGPWFELFADANAAAPVLAGLGDIIAPAVQPPPRPGGIWLVRPDGYVAAVARAADPAPVINYLERFRGR